MCVGKAREVIKSCSVLSPASAGLQQALDLFENFGQKHIVVDAHLNPICKGPPVKPDEESLRKLATELTNYQIVIKAWGFGSLLDSPQTLESVFKRLPMHLQKMFCNKVEKLWRTPCHLWRTHVFCETGRSAQQRLFWQNSGEVDGYWRSRQEKQQIPSRGFTDQVAATSENYDSTVTKDGTACVSCNGNHALYECDNFRKLPVREPWNLVKGKKNCFSCLGRGHMSRECKSNNRCATCNKSHHRLLHKVNSSNASCKKTASDLESGVTAQSSRAQVNYASPITVLSQMKTIRLMVAPVRVYSNDLTHYVDTHAFLDGGSNISLCTTSLMQRLNLRGDRVTRKIEGVAGSK